MEETQLAVRLVEAGAQVLAADGHAGVSLRRVAAAAGVSTMPVYTLFGDKKGLLDAMHREGFRRLGTALGRVDRGDDPIGYLAALGAAYRQIALDNPHLYELMFGHAVPGFQPDATGQAIAQQAYQPLVEAVVHAQNAGQLTSHPAERIALHLWAVAHGMVSLELNGHLPPIADAADLYADALFHAAQPFLSTP